jgi:diguanylate cyclase (GGDEF)-like protein
MRPLRVWLSAGGVLTLLLLLLLPPRALAAEDGAALSRLVLEGYDRPAAVLEILRERPPAGSGQLSLLAAQAQVLVDAGDVDGARTLAERLGSLPDGQAGAALVQALIADRQALSRETDIAASRAWQLLQPGCVVADGTTKLPASCDYLSAWQALRLRSRALQAEGAFAEAAAASRQALQLAELAGDRTLHALGAAMLAPLSLLIDEPEAARQQLALALRLSEGEAALLARVRNIEALVAGRRNDVPGRARALAEALAAARDAGARHYVVFVQTSLVDLHMHAGRAQQALDLAREALPVVLEYRDERLERTLRHNMSVSLIKLGRFDEARREQGRAQELAEQQSLPVSRAAELRELGEAWAAAGQPREALAYYHAERALTAKVDARNREARLAELRVKFDSEREQRNLALLTREKSLQEQQIANQTLARKLGVAVGVLVLLTFVLVVVMLRRVRQAHRQLKANESLLRAQSERDPLTDLANRRHFHAVMEQRFGNGGFAGGLMMVDIDHFKQINDSHGHGAGDAVISEMARRIRAAVRHEDLVVRWGGEEFLVFVSRVEPGALHLLAQRVLAGASSDPVAVDGGSLPVKVSIGFGSFPLPPQHHSQGWEQAVEWVDMALYAAKGQGRNRAVGILGADAPDQESLARHVRGFEQACTAGHVQLETISGPV